MWKISAFSPFFTSPFEYMMMPQATEQYVQVLRVSVVLVSLNGRMAAAQACSTSPKPSAPSVVAARPALAPAMNWRRESSIFILGPPCFPHGMAPAGSSGRCADDRNFQFHDRIFQTLYRIFER